ncbi:MAG: hypothetical protein GY835_24675 [bacterium]|nr:hypothetical protein [bacterium]
MSTSSTSQLVELYDNLRTSALNRKYYGRRLSLYRVINFSLELILAIGTSSALGAWAIFKEGPGEKAWLVISGMAALVALLKPVLNPTKNLERYAMLFAGHGDIYYDLEIVASEVRRHERFTDDLLATYLNTLARIKKIAASDDPNPSRRLLRTLYDEVNQELPAGNFWLPENAMP